MCHEQLKTKSSDSNYLYFERVDLVFVSKRRNCCVLHKPNLTENKKMQENNLHLTLGPEILIDRLSMDLWETWQNVNFTEEEQFKKFNKFYDFCLDNIEA